LRPFWKKPEMKKVLIITYYWPPGSGAGVQRWLKFSKYLPLYGWEPVILTVDPSFATYPVLDSTLAFEIPPHLKVFKTRATDYFRLYGRDKSKVPSSGFAVDADQSLSGWVTKFIRGNFFIPDPRRGWNRYAFREACRIIAQDGITHIITTSPPHSTQLVGRKLRKKYPDIRWIADLRDPWTDIYYYNHFHPTSLARRIDKNYEKSILESADTIITVGNSLKELFAAKIKGPDQKIKVISNGYDPADFDGSEAATPEKFTISYIGTLSDSYPLSGFMEALNKIAFPESGFRLRFVGVVSGKQKELITELAGGSATEFIPYVNHHDAVNYLTGSSALLLIIPDHLSNKSILTGKLFEYLASGRPIICLGPVDGDAGAILRETGHGEVFDYNDADGISVYLKALISGSVPKEKISPAIFRRDNLAGMVASVLDRVGKDHN